VPFTFRESSVVIAGTFNIHIFTPEWLGRIGLVPEESWLNVQYNLDRPGVRFSSPKRRAKWTVSPERLAIVSKQRDENCGLAADKVLETLPWTPITAIGSNFVFLGDENDVQDWPDKTRFPSSDAPAGYELEQRSWHVGLKYRERAVNLQMSRIESGVELRANIHTEVKRKDIKVAREAATDFAAHMQQSIDLFREVFHAEVSDDN